MKNWEKILQIKLLKKLGEKYTIVVHLFVGVLNY